MVAVVGRGGVIVTLQLCKKQDGQLFEGVFLVS